jgi:hypothetical protein
MAKIFIPSSGAEDWKRFLADPEKHWRRGYSAMAAALSWEAAQDIPSELTAILGADLELLFAIPEHKVSLPGGSRQSQCDIFALIRCRDTTCAVAVEAKVSEPFGPTIGQWLEGASEGKITRLKFICDKLALSYPPPPDLRYQLFHRTVAALVEAERFKTDTAAMIIQSFSQKHRWFEDFAAFCALFGAVAARNVPISLRLPDQPELFLGWVTGSKEFC